MAATNADVLREVGETVSSSNDTLVKVTQLIQAATGGLTDAQRDEIVSQLQSVQDANTQVSSAIDAALGNGTQG